ncbi:DUF4230 domain-containing protein [Mucilaginibacter robiniae]|uniref:DUF4230 domain-containing protein n=1 Tax=Mucilaginibacter robiniae TaxID=2728022 RepID=A0A7L5EBF5_9SPHI|nr:DUF4230 domain-containing protein [Mucilaginibacter robiniae]QJD98283.1 DUF4230 domain-containing protein [Mucilaginibacter robiniae]
MLRSRAFRRFLTSVIIIGALVLLALYIKREFKATHTEVIDDVMVEKITSMGKLELVKYAMKDVLEKKEVHMILPDERVLFVAVGEVTACIDLTKIKKQDISSTKDTVTVLMPKPEICYVRLDHQRSKVYDVSGILLPNTAKTMVEDVYKLAEKKLLDNAQELNILGKAQENAQLIFKPLLENIAGKKVVLRFK